MAKIIKAEVASEKITNDTTLQRSLLTGLFMGASYFFVALFLIDFGLNAMIISNIASVVVCFMAMIMLAILRVRYAISVACFSSIALIDTFNWLEGVNFWLSLVITIFLYILSFTFFGWLSKQKAGHRFIIVGMLITLVIRILITF